MELQFSSGYTYSSSPVDIHPLVWTEHHHNATHRPKMLYITPPILPNPSPPIPFHIPPHSAFHLLPCTSPLPPSNSSLFNFILLDPPWPNRSVQRKRAYNASRSAATVQKLLLEMKIESYLAAPRPETGPPPSAGESAHASSIGIWITNKPSIRAVVLGPGGLFAAWGVTLVEEWIWVKTTVHGEPVTPVDGVWRKPYEIFLLGRKSNGSPTDGVSVKRRVVVGVPDLHSRKPGLKQLLERLVLPANYKALEIFARGLMSGWHSWGDQVLMFNWEGCWVDEKEVDS